MSHVLNIEVVVKIDSTGTENGSVTLTILKLFPLLPGPVTENLARDGVNGINPGGRPWNNSFVPLSGLKRIMAGGYFSLMVPSSSASEISSLLSSIMFESRLVYYLLYQPLLLNSVGPLLSYRLPCGPNQVISGSCQISVTINLVCRKDHAIFELDSRSAARPG